jgi:hypothetical protein
VAERIVLSPRMLGRVAADRGEPPREGAARLLAAAARIEREVGGASDDVAAPEVRTLEVDVHLPGTHEARAFQEALGALVERWSPRGPGGEPPTHRVLVAIHPRPSLHASLRDPHLPGEPVP